MIEGEKEKIRWQGRIVSIQPRTRVWRYKIDNRTHSAQGYNLYLEGVVYGLPGSFSVAISEKQQQKLGFQVGDEVTGTAWTKLYDYTDSADLYRAGDLKITGRSEIRSVTPPPWVMDPPDLATYQWRGARMLSLSRYKGKCFQCVWAAMAAVDIEYNWGKTKKHRFESFCYGPKSCKYFSMGKARAVPYKDAGSSWDDGDLDEILTESRDWDE